MYNNGMVVMLLEANIYKFKSYTQIYVWTAPLFAGTNSTYVIVWLFGSEMGNDLDDSFCFSDFLAFWQPSKSLQYSKKCGSLAICSPLLRYQICTKRGAVVAPIFSSCYAEPGSSFLTQNTTPIRHTVVTGWA